MQCYSAEWLQNISDVYTQPSEQCESGSRDPLVAPRLWKTLWQKRQNTGAAMRNTVLMETAQHVTIQVFILFIRVGRNENI